MKIHPQDLQFNISQDYAETLLWIKFKRELFIATGNEMDRAEFEYHMKNNPQFVLYVIHLFEDAVS